MLAPRQARLTPQRPTPGGSPQNAVRSASQMEVSGKLATHTEVVTRLEPCIVCVALQKLLGGRVRWAMAEKTVALEQRDPTPGLRLRLEPASTCAKAINLAVLKLHQMSSNGPANRVRRVSACLSSALGSFAHALLREDGIWVDAGHTGAAPGKLGWPVARRATRVMDPLSIKRWQRTEDPRPGSPGALIPILVLDACDGERRSTGLAD